ncbi:branched-chain amino acid ABC transporter permease [Terasakiella brassicae]|uniref:Branched-chain amino acid ABC transporter permease n=1 Tax=Terasakiella brassicae TaxID=1634917 RepID=A0A917BVR3_9PROT|nr:branched-chain amino acid ABC transporter permease [Terasakiella brassicae]GGF58302.1 branched-chain amino acid ABC transporter permease [Terasakiella brassicae]
MNIKISALMLGVMYLGVPFFLGDNDYLIGLVASALIIAGVAVAWALLGNLGGMVSFGHAAFFGVGAYTSAVLTMDYGVPVFVALVVGGVGASLSSIFMMPALRLRGPYFALAILAYAEIFKILATEATGLTGGAGGLLSIPSLPVFAGVDFGTKLGGYIVILNIVTLMLITYYFIRRSSYGLALKAMHDSELATRIVGVPATYLKVVMLLVSAFMTGAVGAFNAHYINFLEPDYAFSGTWTVFPIVAAIFGGYRTLSGPVLGALFIYLVDQLVFKNLIPQGHQLILGVMLAGMIILSPSGLLPVITNLFTRKKADNKRGEAQHA